MDWIAWIVVAAIIIAWILDKTGIVHKKKEAEELEKEKAPEKVDYSQSYQAKYLLTKNEWYEHKKLQKYAAERGLLVCPKVRLLDIIEPRKGEKNYRSLIYKVQAKHVDFLICDPNMHIKAIIELDDNSHDQKDRRNRDSFVDQILTSVGYKMIHTRYINENTLNEIQSAESKND